MLSLAGLPPLAGFFGKFYLFSVTFRAGENHGLAWLVLIALFGSLVSLYYYLVVLKAAFVEAPAQFPSQDQQLSVFSTNARTATILVCAGGVLLLGITPAPLLNRIVEALT